MKALEVRAYPCDPASNDYKVGPTIANNGAGASLTISSGGYHLKAESITWEHIAWRVAVDGNSGYLWVLCPSVGTVEAHRPALERLAVVVGQYGGIKAVEEAKRKSPSGTVTPRMETKRPMPKPTDKRLALNGITLAVEDALALGASMQDIRLAVFSAMGLDSDAA